MGINGVGFYLDVCLLHFRAGNTERALHIYRTKKNIFNSLEGFSTLHNVVLVLEAMDLLSQGSLDQAQQKLNRLKLSCDSLPLQRDIETVQLRIDEKRAETGHCTKKEPPASAVYM